MSAFIYVLYNDNSLYIRLDHSTKGYTDVEIGVEWIKQFDKQTHAKAAGC
jgi:hypothetical protein